MISTFNYLIDFFIYNFYIQINPARYEAARQYFSNKAIQGKDLLALIFFGLIVVSFIIFLVRAYLKEKNKHK